MEVIQETIGFCSVIPCLITIAAALLTRRTLEPLILGAVSAFVICDIFNVIEGNWIMGFIAGLYETMADGTTVWLYCVCLPFGSLIAIMDKGKGTIGFAEKAVRLANSGTKSLLVAWLLGIAIFCDDYFNALAVGAAMRHLTDKFKVPRELLAYVVNSTGATICCIIPFSTWSAFYISQMEGCGLVEQGGGTSYYFRIIPYMFYSLLVVIMVPLVAAKIFPLYGPMKKAVQRAEAGQCVPDSMLAKVQAKEDAVGFGDTGKTPVRAVNFVVPMVVLAFVAVYTADIQWGVLACLVVCAVMYLPQKLMKPSTFFDTFCEGMYDMVVPCAIVTMAFTLNLANTKMGLAYFIISTFEPLLTPQLFPMIAFIVVTILGFATGCFWGAAAICFPILCPLGMALDANMLLVCGAIIGASSAGSTTCFFSDAPTLTCTSCQISNADYARSILPLFAVPLVLACILYVVFGFIMPLGGGMEGVVAL